MTVRTLQSPEQDVLILHETRPIGALDIRSLLSIPIVKARSNGISHHKRDIFRTIPENALPAVKKNEGMWYAAKTILGLCIHDDKSRPVGLLLSFRKTGEYRTLSHFQEIGLHWAANPDSLSILTWVLLRLPVFPTFSCGQIKAMETVLAAMKRRPCPRSIGQSLPTIPFVFMQRFSELGLALRNTSDGTPGQCDHCRSHGNESSVVTALFCRTRGLFTSLNCREAGKFKGCDCGLRRPAGPIVEGERSNANRNQREGSPGRGV